MTPRLALVSLVFICFFQRQSEVLRVLASMSREDEMTLGDMVDVTLKNNPALMGRQAALRQSHFNNLKTQHNQFPTLSLSSSVSDDGAYGDSSQSSSLSMNLSQTLYQGGSLKAQRNASRQQYTITELSLVSTLQDTLKSLNQTYYDFLLSQAKVKEESEAIERLQQHANNVAKFYGTGRVWKNDVLQAGVKVARGKKELFSAQKKSDLFKARLNQLMGRAIDAPLSVKGSLTRRPHALPSKEEIATALKEHPQFLSSKSSIEKSIWAVRQSEASLWPSLSLSGSASRSDELGPGPHRHESSYTLSLSGRLTLFDFGQRQMDIASRKFSLETTRLGHRELLLKLRLDIQDAMLSVQEASLQMEVLEKALEHAEEAFRINVIRYQEQMGDGNDVLMAQESLKDTRLDELTAISDYEKAIVNLKHALGQLNP